MESFHYNAIYKPNQVICGTGQTAIVTGWTVKQAIAKKLQSHQYAAIGQLYSPARGISFLVRNLLANPHVRFLVLLNATREDQNAGGWQCMADFLRYGFRAGHSDTGRACWVIQSEIPGYIDLEISAASLDQLRSSLEWQEATSIASAVEQVKAFAHRSPLPAWGEPQIFPLAEVQPMILPGPTYGHRIEGKTIAETWVKIIQRIKTTGVIRPTAYDGQWQELINLVAIVTHEPPEFYFPEPNYLPCDRPFIQDYIAHILEDAPQQEGVKYTYGQRLRSWFGVDQVEQVIQKLADDPNSARAVLSLWDVADHQAGSSPPCLNHLWVRIVAGELSLTATFRSNDMFSAWPANAMGLRALQQHICDGINALSGLTFTLGPLMTVSQSAHIYDDCWENADRLIDSQYTKICRQRGYDDPVGSFVISLQDSEIVVEQITPGSGEVVKVYRGRSAQSLSQQIGDTCPGIQPAHALYLGGELQRAETALRWPEQFNFVQDKRF